jgi:hypothetical protein
MLRLLLVVHVDPVVKHDQGAAAEQVGNVSRKDVVDSRAFQALEGFLVHRSVHVVELLHVVGRADEQADGAVARFQLAMHGLAGGRGREAALLRRPARVQVVGWGETEGKSASR